MAKLTTFQFTFDRNEYSRFAMDNDVVNMRGTDAEDAQDRLIERFEEMGVRHGTILKVEKSPAFLQ